MKVHEVMTQDPWTCGLTDPLQRAVNVMWEHDCGCVPVVDRSGKLCGIVTDRDACLAAYTTGLPLAEIAVSTAMTPHPVTVGADDDLTLVEKRMREHRVRRIPVVDGHERPCGIVSI